MTSTAEQLGIIAANQLEAMARADAERYPRRLFGPCTTLTPAGPCGSTALDSTHHCARCGARV